MKRYFLVLFAVSVTASAKDLSCYGEYEWNQDQGIDKAAIVATIEDSGSLSGVTETLQDAGENKPYVYTYETLKADAAYKPSAKKYKGYDRYSLSGGSGWTYYYLLLPKNIVELKKAKGYIQRTGHDAYPTIEMDCSVE
jgi:hypothetical protein